MSCNSGDLASLRPGESAVISQLDANEETSAWLMEAGFVPASEVMFLRAAPGGCPRIYRVDGAEIAIRRELAGNIRIGQPS
jgi:ferrous iron transport protein A